MINRLGHWWKEDVYRRWLLISGFVYAMFFGQGIPLWDDDFTSWFWKIKDKSVFTIFLEWVSPVSTQPQYWGFNERPLQALVYKICYMISGYESWSYMLYKGLIFAGLGVMIYQWGLRVAPKSRNGKLAALAAAICFMVAPGPIAAHVIHSDLAPTAEFIFLVMTYLIWDAVEKTPAEYRGLPKLSNPEHKRWLARWTVLAVCTYLGYKSKADLKLIPGILGAYILVTRRKQLGFFAYPIGLMILLAVPWGGSIFHKLPPFVPGSQGSEIGWMWQPASFDRLREFLWSGQGYDFWTSLRAPTLSLAAVLGPFLLVPMLVFLGWRMEAIDKVNWRKLDEPADRARLFALIWFGAVLAGVSALPAINYIFRVRYGILPLVPASILLAWVFGLFVRSMQSEGATRQLPKWAVGAAVGMLAIQCGVDLNRSIAFRHDLGQVMIAVDQAYGYFAKNFAGDKLTLMPDFRPYDYRTDAPESIRQKDWLQKGDDLRKYPPYKTFVISWKPSLWDQLEMVQNFPGCRETTLFDRVFPCAPGTGTFLMRYIGADETYEKGEQLRQKGDVAGARKLHEEFVAKHPLSLAGQFVIGLEAYQQQDWQRAQQAYSLLESYFPDHLSILYNHALALEQLKQYGPAIDRLSYIAARDPANYAVMIHLYWNYQKNDQQRKAVKTLERMKTSFPNDPEVNRLLAGSKS